jgi:hypothetical protein
MYSIRRDRIGWRPPTLTCAGDMPNNDVAPGVSAALRNFKFPHKLAGTDRKRRMHRSLCLRHRRHLESHRPADRSRPAWIRADSNRRGRGAAARGPAGHSREARTRSVRLDARRGAAVGVKASGGEPEHRQPGVSSGSGCLIFRKATRIEQRRGRRIMVIPKLPKLEPWVRFPSPAPLLRQR